MRDISGDGFYKSDVEQAHLAFSLWQSTQSETVDEYLMRKRKIELNCLVNEVIENELTEQEKEIVRMHWFEEKNISEIAKILGINHSNVSRKLDKINNTIYDKLKYAIQYRYGKDYSASVKVIIKNKDALCLMSGDLNSPARRIRDLRIRQGLTLKDAEAMTGISLKKFGDIESGKSEIFVSDVMRIATAFKTSGDYIIFGKNQGGTANGFINQ